MKIFIYLSLLLGGHAFALPEAEFTVYSHKARLPAMTEAYYQNTAGFGFWEFLGDSSFVTHDGLNIDKAMFTTSLKKFGVDSTGKGNATGYVLLDWETGPYRDMQNCLPASTCYKAAEAKFIEALTFARTIQPRMKFGFYALPFRTWNQYQMDTFNQPGKFNNILSKVDFIAGSIYQLYPEGYVSPNVDRARILKYFQDNMNTALDYGVRLNKPVYMYMWHRITNRALSSTYQYRFLRKDKFASDVKFVKSHVAPNGGKVKGVILWEAMSAANGGGTEDYIIGNRGLDDHLVTTMSSLGYDGVVREYAKSIKAAVDSIDTQTTVQKVTTFELVNADTNQKIRNIVQGESISLASLPTKNFSIRAITSPLKVGSVKFILDSSAYRTENLAPYSLKGDDSKLYPLPWYPVIKSYTLIATPYSGSSGGGTKGQPLSVTFNIVR